MYVHNKVEWSGNGEGEEAMWVLIVSLIICFGFPLKKGDERRGGRKDGWMRDLA